MRLLPSPPKFQNTPANFKFALEHLAAPSVQPFIAEANREYYHWDKLRYLPPPEGLTPQQAWMLVKWSRQGKTRSLPLADERGRAFSYWLPDQAMAILHEVDRGGGGMLAIESGTASSFDVIRDRVVISSLMEEAIATSQIEGAVTTRKVAKEMLRSKRKPRNRSEQMIANSYRTILLLRERLDRPLSIELLNEIQESMTRDTLDDPTAAGRFRTGQEPVTIIDTRDNEVVFTPPPAKYLRERIEKLLAFVNGQDALNFTHPLVKAAILHFWLAYEYPYVDGNGRTARALYYWYALKAGYWLFEFLTISRVLLASAAQYYKAFLHSEHDNNDLTYSIMLQLRATQQALLHLRRYIAEKQDEQNRMLVALRRFPGLNHRQRALLDHALRKPGQTYTFQSHGNTHGVTYVTARSDLLDLTERRLLQEVRIGKQRGFIAMPRLADQLSIKTRRRRRPPA